MNASKIIGLVLLAYGALAAAEPMAVAEPLAIKVWRDPSCSCCKRWISHLEANGFVVQDHLSNDMQAQKTKHKVPTELASCHTATINGYTIEGHVPADDIKKLLRQKPIAAGIAVPGMPAGSPGMEMGNRRDPYQVLLFGKGKKAQVFSEHGKSE